MTVLREDEDRDFLPAVREFATLCGWLVYHAHDSRRSTPGFPDLVLCRRGRLIFAELKSQRGALSAAQREWGFALSLTGCVEYYRWRPADRPELERILR